MNGSVLHVDPTTSAKMGANTVQFCIYPVYVIFGLEDGTVVKGGFIFLSRDLKHDRHQVGSCFWIVSVTVVAVVIVIKMK